MNEKPFVHVCGRFKFTSPRCDFQGGVWIEAPESFDPIELVAAVAEMIGYHATSVWPELKHFSGYDAIEWKAVPKADSCTPVGMA